MTSLVRADHHHGHQGDPSVGYSFAKFSGPVSGKKHIPNNFPLTAQTYKLKFEFYI